MSKSKCIIPELFLINIRIVHFLDDLASFKEAAEKFIVFLETVKVFYYLLQLVLLQTVPIVKSFRVNVEHLTRVLRLVEVEVVQCFLSFDDAR